LAAPGVSEDCESATYSISFLPTATTLGRPNCLNQAVGTLATLKAERASVAARSRQAEIEAAPIRYIVELLGDVTDGERAIRWLIAVMVLCCDPLAIALTAAASADRGNRV
jgi:hypothetical protein